LQEAERELVPDDDVAHKLLQTFGERVLQHGPLAEGQAGSVPDWQSMRRLDTTATPQGHRCR
jgi:hypothetical protein